MSLVASAAALVLPFAAGIAITPNPIAVQIGPFPVFWYGICYAIGLTAAYLVITREARRRGLDAGLVDNGIIVVGVAALIGGRLYHVIDQWQLYSSDPLKIILPPYTGLGVYGGIATGFIAAVLYTRRHHQYFWLWADVIAPGLFVMQAIGRWGNFFNQELYGPPTGLPWGIAIDCAHRIPEYPCTTYPEAVTFFHPLFLYESVSGALGAVVLLFLARRIGDRLRPGDLAFGFFIWYGAVRFALEFLRADNWRFFGIPVAQLVSGAVILASMALLAWRHRPGAASGDRWSDYLEEVDDEDQAHEDELDESERDKDERDEEAEARRDVEPADA